MRGADGIYQTRLRQFEQLTQEYHAAVSPWRALPHRDQARDNSPAVPHGWGIQGPQPRAEAGRQARAEEGSTRLEAVKTAKRQLLNHCTGEIQRTCSCGLIALVLLSAIWMAGVVQLRRGNLPEGKLLVGIGAGLSGLALCASSIRGTPWMARHYRHTDNWPAL
jgi:hypothetical protein